jgi:hypothetical protein
MTTGLPFFQTTAYWPKRFFLSRVCATAFLRASNCLWPFSEGADLLEPFIVQPLSAYVYNNNHGECRDSRLCSNTNTGFSPSKAKSSRQTMCSSISCRKIRLAEISCRSGSSGDSPAAIKSALIKRVQPATFGRYSNAKVVLPAPLGPATIQQVGISFILASGVRTNRTSGQTL